MARPVWHDLPAWHDLDGFLHEEDGAVTVDWVVLTAAVIGMGIVFLRPIATGTESLASAIGLRISEVEVGSAADGDADD